jgi:LuxR family transcriptional regulator, maltose regulon positive regulatory protein
MATATPYVHDHVLTMRDVQHPLESQSWWDWLNEAGTTTFRFTSLQGHYTARRESKRGRWYWNAYRKQHGKLAKVYLGKSEELTEQRLLEVAQKVTERCQQQSRQNSTEQDFFFALKLVPPSLRPSLVARPRLVEAVNNAVQHTLTLICAAAGSGKSTLLSTWYANSLSISRAWVTLDEADNEPSRFWMALISALQRCFPAVGQRALTMLRSPQPLAIEAILASLISDISTLSKDTIIVLVNSYREPYIYC